jgi:hypothetical protein
MLLDDLGKQLPACGASSTPSAPASATSSTTGEDVPAGLVEPSPAPSRF